MRTASTITATKAAHAALLGSACVTACVLVLCVQPTHGAVVPRLRFHELNAPKGELKPLQGQDQLQSQSRDERNRSQLTMQHEQELIDNLPPALRLELNSSQEDHLDHVFVEQTLEPLLEQEWDRIASNSLATFSVADTLISRDYANIAYCVGKVETWSCGPCKTTDKIDVSSSWRYVLSLFSSASDKGVAMFALGNVDGHHRLTFTPSGCC
eukprot:m.93812 g.93812  ORF g.93812 m.93812 type:complete len:212 (+) comp13010_c1_seq11:169-804(+)